jgi:F-type H+-transporting ATPase subunit delta
VALSDVIALRYANAFFDLAAADKAIERRRESLATAVARLAAADVTAILTNPKVEMAQKVAFADSMLDGLDDTVRNLVRLLIERQRAAVLPLILEGYDRLADQAGGRVRAEVVSAVPLDGATEQRVREELARRLGGEVHTTVRQDPSIIGGLIIRIGDRVIDGSVRTRLQELQSALA